MFGPGPRPVPPGTEPVSLPVQIVQNNGGNLEVIRDFGVVPIDEDKTFGDRVSFERDRAGTAPDHPTPNPDIRGSPSDSSGSESSVSSGSSASGSDGSGDGGSKSGSSGNDGRIDSIGSITGLLPSTGGMVLGTLVVGALLAGGGLLILRHAR